VSPARKGATLAEAAHAAPGSVHQFWDLEGDLELACDAVIVGSGAGGATVACELAEGGLSVIVLEEGGVYDTKSFTSDAMTAVKRYYRSAGAEIIQGKPPIILAQGRCLGGSTVINGGMSWRTPEPILDRWTREIGLPHVSPEAMVPIFDRIEARLHVGVQRDDTLGRDDQMLRLGAERLGFAVTKNRRNQRHCMGSNNCAFGCPTGGKQSMLVSYLPRAVAFGARIYTDVRAERIVTGKGSDGRKKATGVIGQSYDPATGRKGPRLTVRAEHVVLCGGATQTPVLLQKNKLANRSGQVGRNFTVHPNAKCIGIFDEPIYGWRGVHQGHQVHEFLQEGLLMAIAFLPPQILAMTLPFVGDRLFEVLQKINHMVVAGALVEDTVGGLIRPGPKGQARMSYQLTPYDVERLVRATGLTAELLFAAGAAEVILPVHGYPILTEPDQIRGFLSARIQPHDFEVVTVHPMGTCRIGMDPRHSVAGPFGETHDVQRLYVADASALPTAIGINPMLSIMALATRTALAILGGV
jgi:choline dehydrogenase-like flavoprotein